MCSKLASRPMCRQASCSKISKCEVWWKRSVWINCGGHRDFPCKQKWSWSEIKWQNSKFGGLNKCSWVLIFYLYQWFSNCSHRLLFLKRAHTSFSYICSQLIKEIEQHIHCFEMLTIRVIEARFHWCFHEASHLTIIFGRSQLSMIHIF